MSRALLICLFLVGCSESSVDDNGGDGDGFDCVESETDSDPNNCGACGRTCVIPNSLAGCELGECVIASCDVGFFDDDGDIDNGCEVDESVVPSNECTTICGSIGTLDPEDESGQTCTPPAEQCNAFDDNCDGTCDEDRPSGCRVAVHRSFGNGHLFTTDLTAAQTAPYSIEAQSYFYIYADASAVTETVFLCEKPDGKHIVTAQASCEGVGAQVRTLGAWASAQDCGAVPVYRVYHAPTNNHFYTLSAAERDNAVNNLGYTAQGVAGYVWTAP